MAKKTVTASKLNIDRTMVDKDALTVIEKLQSNGFAAYIVGGGIRDLLLGKKPKDYDIVTDAEPEKIRKIFSRNSLIIGRRFKLVHVIFERHDPERSAKNGYPTFTKHIIEVSTYRSKKVHNHAVSEHGRILVDNNYGTINEDAFRRDFTINALYYDPIAEVVIDYHDGIKDIENRTLRIIGNPHERYLEDPVRVLRAIRLSEKLNLAIDENTYINFRNVKHLLINEPKGRLFEEMVKILMSGSSVKIIVELHELGLPRRVFNLFDKIMFHARPDEFALEVMQRTDNRINDGEDVSLIYILSGLLWQTVNHFWDHEKIIGAHFRQGLIDAIAKTKNLIFNSGITRNLYTGMRDIWLLQLEFEYPGITRIDHLLKHNRFRQALHLFNLRNDFHQINKETHDWWDKYLVAEENELRLELLEKLSKNEEQKTNKKKKRKRRKKRNTNEIENFNE